MSTEEPKVVVENGSDSDTEQVDVNAQEEEVQAGDAEEASPEQRKYSKAEKKARKLVSKLGLKELADGCRRVSFKRKQGDVFAITKPDVYEAGKYYLVFGVAMQDDGFNQQHEQAAKKFEAPMGGDFDASAAGFGASAGADAFGGAIPEETADDAEPAGDIDESDLNPAEIDTVMQQTSVSREKAVAALKKHRNIVDAILALSP